MIAANINEDKPVPTNTSRGKKMTTLLPEGGIATRTWLMNNGLERHAIDNLIKSDQLGILVPGVYSRPDGSPTWQGVMYFFQKAMGLNLTIGGLTALDLLGLSHYLPLGVQKKIHVYGTDKLPSWTNRVDTGADFQWHSEWDLLGKRRPASNIDKDPLEPFTHSYSWKEGQSELIISSPERALLEILAGVPNETSVEHADQLIQGMTSLSPRALQALPQQCENIKVRRLFFWLADRYRHPWLEKLNPEKIDLGSGKRMLVKGGRLDKKYNITVPKFL